MFAVSVLAPSGTGLNSLREKSQRESIDEIDRYGFVQLCNSRHGDRGQRFDIPQFAFCA